jgi:hypothetical protein
MKTRYRLTYRGIRGGMYYCVDKTTGKRTSLQTTNKDEAHQIVEAKNTAERQPVLNLQIAKAYIAGTDSGRFRPARFALRQRALATAAILNRALALMRRFRPGFATTTPLATAAESAIVSGLRHRERHPVDRPCVWTEAGLLTPRLTRFPISNTFLSPWRRPQSASSQLPAPSPGRSSIGRRRIGTPRHLRCKQSQAG